MTPTDATNTVSPERLAAILARRKWQILITFFVVVVGVVADALLMPKEYQTRLADSKPPA
jgi:uncharacterized protein involved in exopolysaccharide biosynthesis